MTNASLPQLGKDASGTFGEADARSAIHFTRAPTGEAFAHVMAKRTYQMGNDGALVPHPEQLTLIRDLLSYDDDGPTRWEPDFFACGSSGTDLVVQGSAHAVDGKCRRLSASVFVERGDDTARDAEARARTVLVLGNRKLYRRGGAIEISEPDEFLSMPLTYAHAYGGSDAHANESHPEEMVHRMAEEAGSSPATFFQNTYPRNRKGRGYVIYDEPGALEAMTLPNVELPNDLLTVERLVLGGAEHWPRAPFPAGFDWFGQENFPRSAFFGICPAFEGAAADLLEVQNGFLPAELTTGGFFENLVTKHSMRWFRGATPWLLFPTFVGNEIVHVRNMHPKRPHIEVALPREVPKMVLELFGKARRDLTPHLRRVVLQPDAERLVTLWVGTVAIDRAPSRDHAEKARHAVRWGTGA